MVGVRKKRVSIKYVIFIKNMYINIVICVRIGNDEFNIFSIKIKLYQRSTLSLYIFILVMNKITKNI
jgi:predicted Fe-Mo cluster-binding NifX family protein